MQETFKERCIHLRNKGLSLGTIATITGKSKTSIYFHIRDIPLPPEKKRQSLLSSTTRIINFNKGRKGTSLLGRHPTKFDNWTKKTVRLTAHVAFDGELSRNSVMYHNRSAILSRQFQRLMRLVYTYPPKILYQKSGVIRTSYHNVELTSYLSNKKTGLFREIVGLNKECKREFLRTFFDDEGCMDFRPKKNVRQVRG